MPKTVLQPATQNLILAALPRNEYEHLFPHFERVSLPQGKVIYYAGDIVRYCYFINDGQVSLVSVTSDGSTMEVARVGSEGAIGIPVILRSNKTPCEVRVQVPVSSAFRIKAEVIRNEFDRCGKFQELLLRYTQVLFTQIAQSAVCNHFHSSAQRLARWLLVADDLARSHTFLLTHEAISYMLGTPRTGVTMAAGSLQQTGLIDSRRGKIVILDRAGLEASSCECYGVIRESFDHLFDGEKAS